MSLYGDARQKKPGQAGTKGELMGGCCSSGGGGGRHLMVDFKGRSDQSGAEGGDSVREYPSGHQVDTRTHILRGLGEVHTESPCTPGREGFNYRAFGDLPGTPPRTSQPQLHRLSARR